MAVSKANQRAVNKYVKANYDRINVTMPKGEKEVIQEHATATGESVNGFIIRAVRERMERDSGGDSVAKCDGTSPVKMTGQRDAGAAPVERVLAETPTGRPSQAAGATAGAGVVSLPLDTLEAAQRAAERAGETVATFVTRAVADQEKRDNRSFQMGINPATGDKMKKEA